MKKIGILGSGEIGSAINKVYQEFGYETLIKDPHLNKNDEMQNIYILNVCFPYSENFVEILNNYIDEIQPEIIVIHSTVAPGTTKLVKGRVCHSPVRGLHPNLDTGIKTFLKFIGSEDNSVSQEYSNHLREINISSFVCQDSLTSELAKLLDTTYYGLCIAFHNDVNILCKKLNVNFDEVMTVYNETYNQGYSILNKNNVIRPVLTPGEKIGGHCVIPNAKILSNHTDLPFLNEIIKYE